MKSKPLTGKYLLPVFLACFSVALIAWGGQKQPRQQKTAQSFNDTVPKNKPDKKIRDLDDALGELDKADFKLDMEKAKARIEEAVKQIDMAKIQMEVDKAMKEVDMEK